MTDIIQRFNSLPRARRGTQTMVVASEEELAKLIADAQEAEAALFEQGIKRARSTPLPPAPYVPPTIRITSPDTPANESGLTPLPLEEQVPGAWNFR